MPLMAHPQSARTLDDRGRITIERQLRKFLKGDRIVQVATPHGVLLRPAQDPLDVPPGQPLSEVDTEAVAMEEIDEELREIQGPRPIEDP